MRVRDQILRGFVYAGADAETVVRVHRLAPLVEYAVELQQAVASEAVLEAAVAERTSELLAIVDELAEQVILARRRALLAEARVAAIEVIA